MTMTITVKNEMSFNDLMTYCWSGAFNTLKKIEKEGKEDELMDHLGSIFYDTCPTMTELNDYLWFDNELIYDALGIIEEEE